MVVRLFRYQFSERKGLILQWNEGWGEIAPLPGFSKETLLDAQNEIRSFFSSGTIPKCPSVRFALASAFRPLQSIRVPLCALNTPKNGCSTLKLKVGHLSPQEATLLAKSYLPHYRLRIDCNRSWNLDQALAFASYFSPADFEYIEEPVQTPGELITFSNKTQFPIALDETFRESGPIALPTLKAIVIKPTLSGTVPPIPRGIHLVLSSSYESSLGILQIARLATSAFSFPKDDASLGAPCIPTSDFSHGLDTFSDDLLSPPLRVENGHLLWTSSQNPIRTDLLCPIAL